MENNQLHILFYIDFLLKGQANRLIYIEIDMRFKITLFYIKSQIYILYMTSYMRQIHDIPICIMFTNEFGSKKI